jgi:hypothetical protein
MRKILFYFYQCTLHIHNWVRHNCCVRKGCGTIGEAHLQVRLQLAAAQLLVGAAQLLVGAAQLLVGAAQLGMAQPERSKTEGGSEGPDLALSAGAQTIFLLEREDLVTSLLLCPVKMFRQGTKMLFLCYGIFSAICFVIVALAFGLCVVSQPIVPYCTLSNENTGNKGDSKYI